MIASVCLLTALVSIAGSDQDQKDFSAANEKALSGDNDGALALYGHLLSRGVEHEDVYFNQGTTFARAGRLVDAAVAFEHALVIEPRDADARHNLELIRKKLRPRDRGAQDSAVHATDVITAVIGNLPRSPIRWIAVFTHALIYVLWFLRHRARSDGARSRFGLGMLFAGLLFVTTGAVALGHEISAIESRGVSLEAASLKEGPHDRFGETAKLYAGEPVRIRTRDGDWVEVSGEDGRRGWARSSAVATVH